jgi:hypothetical protein
MDEISTAAPKTEWACHSHFYCLEHKGYKVGMCASVWGIGCSPTTPEFGGGYGYGWKSDFRLMTCARYLPTEYAQLHEIRTTSEDWLGARADGEDALNSPLNGCKGLGRMGADFWPVLKDSRGTITHRLCGRYPESGWGQLKLDNCTVALLSPGPEGPLATVRSAILRMAVQEIEARVFIERALLDKQQHETLGEDLAKRCRRTLNNRIRAAYFASPFFEGSGYRERAELLFELAQQVAEQTGKGNRK